MSQFGDISIRTVPRPGDVGEVVRQHGLQYAALLGLDVTFETYVARPLSDFILDYAERGDAAGRLWIAQAKTGRTWRGSVAMLPVDHGDAGASGPTDQLRWFLVDEGARGQGLGRRLLDEAIDFARARDRERIVLWTLAELPAALTLYERAGFSVTETKPGNLWGRACTELKMELAL